MRIVKAGQKDEKCGWQWMKNGVICLMTPTHYEPRYKGVAILNLSTCKECELPLVNELNFYHGPNALKGVNLPILPKLENTCDGDCG